MGQSEHADLFPNTNQADIRGSRSSNLSAERDLAPSSVRKNQFVKLTALVNRRAYIYVWHHFPGWSDQTCVKASVDTTHISRI